MEGREQRGGEQRVESRERRVEGREQRVESREQRERERERGRERKNFYYELFFFLQETTSFWR